MVDHRELVSVRVLDESAIRRDWNQYKVADLQLDVPSIKIFFKGLVPEGGASFS